MSESLKIILIMFLSLIVLSTDLAQAQSPQKAGNIRIGWQVPWAVQGQLVQVLKNTDILKKNNLKVKFIGRTFGPELNELAIAGAVDVILTADQPAATLFAKSEDWIGIARLMYNRTATYVPLASKINSVVDLKNKTIALPVGAAAQRILELELLKNNISPQEDVKIVNLNIQEQVPMAKKTDKNSEKWDQFDAFAGFDPIPAILQSNSLAKIIHEGKVCSMVVINKNFAEANPETVKKLVKVIKEAWEYYKANQVQADSWFIKEAKLQNIDSNVLKLTTVLEPNFSEKVRLDFNESDYQVLQQASEFIEPIVKKKVDMRSRVTNRFLN